MNSIADRLNRQIRNMVPFKENDDYQELDIIERETRNVEAINTDLLEALENAHDYLHSFGSATHQEIVDCVEAAIAKAKGESA